MISKELCEHLLALEASLHRAETRRSRAALERLLAPEFLEFGRSGRACDRQSTIAALVNEEVDPNAALPRISDVGCIALSDDCALLTYRSARVVEGVSVETLRSSVWKRREGQWSMVFHQGTPAPGIPRT